MTMFMRRSVLAAMVLGFTSLAVADEAVDTLEKKIHAAWEKQKSMTAKLTMITKMEMGGMSMDGKGDGTVEFMRNGDKVLSRTEVKTTMTRKMGDQETKMEQPMTSIIDGEFNYTLTEMMGQKMAMKSKIDPRMTGEPKGMFEELHKEYELKLLPDETVDTMKCYAIEATPKEKTQAGGGKMNLYFDQPTGFVVKMIMFGPDDKPATTMTYSEMKFDVKIDPDRFKFKAPEGVQVIDQTKEGGEAPPPPAATKPAKPE